MYFQPFYLSCLSQASYVLASEGIGAVVDPRRDVDIYLEDARANGYRIEHIIETHLHADFVSGHNELAARTGAQVWIGHRAGAAFPHVPIHEGDSLRFGHCCVDFLETPGHTLESICAVVTDLEKSDRPFAVLTGDTLFIGDVGRPDLSPDHTPQQLAGLLFDSLHGKLLKLDDSVAVYPAHGAGSLCGRQMSSERSSTIGKERLTNYALRPSSREDFVRLLTAELPERPGYFSSDVEINRSGAAAVSDLPEIPGLTPQQTLDAQRNGAILLDTRSPSDFTAAYVPGSLNLGLGGQFASWAGTLIGIGPEIVLIAEDDEKASESRLRLARVGIERVIGYLQDGFAAWAQSGLPVETIPQIQVEALHQLSKEEVQILDVRRTTEWEQGHVAGATLVPLNRLSKELGTLDRERTIAVHCQGGYRSAIAGSLLKRAGFSHIMNVTGGFDAWRACRLPEAQT